MCLEGSEWDGGWEVITIEITMTINIHIAICLCHFAGVEQAVCGRKEGGFVSDTCRKASVISSSPPKSVQVENTG